MRLPQPFWLMFGPLTEQDEGMETNACSDDRFEQIPRRRVDPMQIFDHQYDRGNTAARLKKAQEQVTRALAYQQPIQSRKRSRRWRKTEQIECSARSGSEKLLDRPFFWVVGGLHVTPNVL